MHDVQQVAKVCMSMHYIWRGVFVPRDTLAGPRLAGSCLPGWAACWLRLLTGCRTHGRASDAASHGRGARVRGCSAGHQNSLEIGASKSTLLKAQATRRAKQQKTTQLGKKQVEGISDLCNISTRPCLAQEIAE